MGDMFALGIWFVMAFVLVGSSLVMRRLPRGNLFRLVLIWVLIFAIGWMAVQAFRLVSG